MIFGTSTFDFHLTNFLEASIGTITSRTMLSITFEASHSEMRFYVSSAIILGTDQLRLNLVNTHKHDKTCIQRGNGSAGTKRPRTHLRSVQHYYIGA
jgi:hypothetical protein